MTLTINIAILVFNEQEVEQEAFANKGPSLAGGGISEVSITPINIGRST